MNRSLLVALRLSKEGFGTPTQILRMPVSVVLGALNYSQFIVDYQNAYTELNKQTK